MSATSPEVSFESPYSHVTAQNYDQAKPTLDHSLQVFLDKLAEKGAPIEVLVEAANVANHPLIGGVGFTEDQRGQGTASGVFEQKNGLSVQWEIKHNGPDDYTSKIAA